MNGVGNLVFADANVILYAMTTGDAQKHSLARDWMSALWASSMGRVSWQVLCEFYVNAVRKAGMPIADARRAVKSLTLWNPLEISFGLVERAWHWEDKAHVSWWDALIIAAAERAGCRWLLTEDLQHGRQFGAVHVVSPFRTKPEDLDLSASRPN